MNSESDHDKKGILKLKLFRTKKVWQGLENGNIAFSEELDFDVSELDFIFERPREEFQSGNQPLMKGKKFGDSLTMNYARNMKIFFARHGRTNYNDLDLCNSDPDVDVHITSEGIKQAQALADKLKGVPIERIIISELKRTRQTAEIVNKFHHVPVAVDPLLNDHRSGYEGKSAKLLVEAMDTADNRWTARFNGGESIEDMKQRVAKFLEDLQAKPYDDVLVITSGWIIKMAVAIIQHIPNEEAWMTDAEQGSYLEFEV